MDAFDHPGKSEGVLNQKNNEKKLWTRNEQGSLSQGL